MGSGAFLVEACRQLAEVLVKAWHAHSCLPNIPADENELLHAQRLVAQRCLYGVDKNPMAVDLAKLSLWLATLAKDHPFTFLDHNLRAGNSLVGLTKKQLIEFHWLPCKQRVIGQEIVEERITSATACRQKILDAGDYVLPGMRETQLANADEALGLVRFAGNLVVAAYFAEDKDKARGLRRDEYLTLLSEYLRTGNVTLRPNKQEAALRDGPHPVTPFHWEVEFPEVFGRKEAGFDCIVGNPPFAGKNTIADGNRPGFGDWLKATHAESHGNADLVAHFFRRAFDLLKPGGTFGLIATNTIAQGDTRSSGLRWICTHGGTLYAARRRYKWPGMAAVVVSVIHGIKGAMPGKFDLDGKPAERITAYLFHAGGNDDPARLASNAGKSFQGSIVLGMGFTFDDQTNDPAANPISLMHELTTKDPRNAERIFPYIGGEEVNNHPEHKHHHYAMNFGEMSEEQARQWPDLMEIAEQKVKPSRDKDNCDVRRKYWWRYGETAPALYDSVKKMERVLTINCGATPHMSFVIVSGKSVFANSLDIFPFDTRAAFAAMQSRPHEVWARFFASSMKDDLRYTPSDCFETFPFPPGFETSPALEAVGQAYYEFRAALMIRNNEGLTKTYNRFHDPHERNADILKLRTLHADMDRAVLAAYGPPFSELVIPPCDFILDYDDEDDDDEEATPGARRKKKPYRYRWPDVFRDEVLALLLELNKQRAAKEKKPASGKPKAKPAPRRKSQVPKNEVQGDLF